MKISQKFASVALMFMLTYLIAFTTSALAEENCISIVPEMIEVDFNTLPHKTTRTVYITNSTTSEKVFIPKVKDLNTLQTAANKQSHAQIINVKPKYFKLPPNKTQKIEVDIAFPHSSTEEVMTLLEFESTESPKRLNKQILQQCKRSKYAHSMSGIPIFAYKGLTNNDTQIKKLYYQGNEVIAELKNTGNMHAQINGTFEIFHNNKSIYTHYINQNITLLPKSSQEISFVIPASIKDFGRYTAKLTIDYEDHLGKREIITADTEFLVNETLKLSTIQTIK